MHKTLEKQCYLEAQGYTYICMWECNFKRQLAKNADMKTYINDLEITLALEPRDAFYGNAQKRSNCMTKLPKAKQ